MITDGLKLHYNFSHESLTLTDGVPTSVIDQTDGNITASIPAGSTIQRGLTGNAIRLDGSTTGIAANFGGCGGTAFSIAMKVKGEDVSMDADQRLFQTISGFGAQLDWARTWAASGRFYLGKTDTTYYTSPTIYYEEDQWYDIVLTFNGTTTAILYLDGAVLITYDAMTDPDTGNAATINFGDNFVGLIDDIRIYNRAITQDEVTTLYNLPYNLITEDSGDLKTGFISERLPACNNALYHFPFDGCTNTIRPYTLHEEYNDGTEFSYSGTGYGIEYTNFYISDLKEKGIPIDQGDAGWYIHATALVKIDSVRANAGGAARIYLWGDGETITWIYGSANAETSSTEWVRLHISRKIADWFVDGNGNTTEKVYRMPFCLYHFPNDIDDGTTYMKNLLIYAHPDPDFIMPLITEPSVEQGLTLPDYGEYVGCEKASENIIKTVPKDSVNQTYLPPGTYQPGWNSIKHNDAIVIDGWSSGYNSGTTDASICYHAKWVYEGTFGRPCVRFNDLEYATGKYPAWLGTAIYLADVTSDLGWTVGTEVTISFRVKTSKLSKAINVGVYHYQIDTGTTSFENSIDYVYSTKVGVWEKKSFTFTVNSNYDLTKYSRFYLYGQVSDNGILWVEDIQIETKPYATEYTEDERIIDCLLTYPINLSPQNESFTLHLKCAFNGDDPTNSIHRVDLNNFGHLWLYVPHGSDTQNRRLIWDYKYTGTRCYRDLQDTNPFVRHIPEWITFVWDHSVGTYGTMYFYRNGELWSSLAATADCTLGNITELSFQALQAQLHQCTIIPEAQTAEQIQKFVGTEGFQVTSPKNIITRKLIEIPPEHINGDSGFDPNRYKDLALSNANLLSGDMSGFYNSGTNETFDNFYGEPVTRRIMGNIGDWSTYSEQVAINPNEAYLFSLWMQVDVKTAGRCYFGLTPYNSGDTNHVLYEHTNAVNTNAYFLLMDDEEIPKHKWLNLRGYLIPESYTKERYSHVLKAIDEFRIWDQIAMGDSDSTWGNTVWKMPSDLTHVKMRFLDYYNDGNMSSSFITLPMIIPIRSLSATNNGIISTSIKEVL